MSLKSIYAILAFFFLPYVAFATNKDLEKDITMVSYEQSWLDYKGTLALRNNTNGTIKNVNFVIKYFDMSGTELDYKEFFKEVEIYAGMTKKIDIPAYEHSRHYHYYKTKDEFGHPSFKIKFLLRDYNINTENEDSIKQSYNYNIETDDNNYKDNDPSLLSFISFSITLLIIIGITIGLYVLVAVMAKNRNRNVAIWILLSLITTPLLMVIILLAIGKDDKQKYQKE